MWPLKKKDKAPNSPNSPKFKLGFGEQKFEKPNPSMVPYYVAALVAFTIIGDQLLWHTSGPFEVLPDEMIEARVSCDKDPVHAVIRRSSKGPVAQYRCGGTFLHLWPFYDSGASLPLGQLVTGETGDKVTTKPTARN